MTKDSVHIALTCICVFTGQTGQTETGSKKALPALAMTALKNPKVQEAVVDKGLEVMGKLVDKQLKIIDEAQEKASKFLAKEVRVRELVVMMD